MKLIAGSYNKKKLFHTMHSQPAEPVARGCCEVPNYNLGFKQELEQFMEDSSIRGY